MVKAQNQALGFERELLGVETGAKVAFFDAQAGGAGDGGKQRLL